MMEKNGAIDADTPVDAQQPPTPDGTGGVVKSGADCDPTSHPSTRAAQAAARQAADRRRQQHHRL